MELASKVIEVFGILLHVALVAIAVIAAVLCGQKKLRTVGPWLMSAGFGVTLLTTILFFVLNSLRDDTLSLSLKRVLYLCFGCTELGGVALVAVGVGLLSAKFLPSDVVPSNVKSEVSHG